MSFSNPPPPSYGSSLKLSLLCLDGGGTRTFVQLQILCELMHRLAWDMGLISSRPSIPQKCHIYPADCFDYIGAGGCGTIIAYLLAAGHTAESALTQFLTLTPLLASTLLHAHPAYPGESLTELEIALDACLPRHELMPYQEDWIVDIPARTNVWIASPSSDTSNSNLDEKFQGLNGTSNGPGFLVPKGAPLRLSLLPLVLAEVEREMRGGQSGLEHTLEFLQAVCPVFEDCDLLLALGSGQVPVQQKEQIRARRNANTTSRSTCSTEKESVNSTSPSSTELDSSSYPSSSFWLATTIVCLLTWLCYTTSTSSSGSNLSLSPSTCGPPQLPTPLPPCTSSREQSRALHAYIPTRAYGRSYIRLSPDLTTRACGTLRAGLTTYSTSSPNSSTPSSSSSSSSSSSLSGQPQLAWPADWEPQHFSEHRMLATSYCGKAEVEISMDRVVHVLGRREFPGVSRTGPNSREPFASTSASVSAPQYCLTAGKAKEQARMLMSTLENKRRFDEMVFERAGFVY